MPTYTFYNKDTDEQFDEFMSWSEREKYLKDNPHIEPMLTTAAPVSYTHLTLPTTSSV